MKYWATNTAKWGGCPKSSPRNANWMNYWATNTALHYNFLNRTPVKFLPYSSNSYTVYFSVTVLYAKSCKIQRNFLQLFLFLYCKAPCMLWRNLLFQVILILHAFQRKSFRRHEFSSIGTIHAHENRGHIFRFSRPFSHFH